MGPEDHALPPDNFQEVPDPRVAHRTSPTNIGMGLLSTLAAHDLGFIEAPELARRVDATLTTMEGLERFEGHLFNWYDTLSLAPLLPRYVSSVDSGNLAAALLVLSEGLRALGQDELARRAAAFANGMSFRLLYDPKRQLLSIGYRSADAEGQGRLDPAHYDLLASEARLASFLAIAKGDLPEAHWFHLGRSATSVHGVPTLLSWSASMFEYLMPLLVMRRYPETLLDDACRMAVLRQQEYASARGVPWGISESAYDAVDLHDNYQYRAFGVPGLGLKRGLASELVVAPYATALAALVEPAAAAENLRRLAAEGLEGAYGMYDAIDYTRRRDDDEPEDEGRPRDAAAPRGRVVRAYFAHHQGMTLTALANVLCADRMVQRFHADPRVRATALLLQERVPRHVALVQPRPDDETRIATPTPTMAVRRFRSPHTGFPARAVPVERRLHRRGDERRRRREQLARPGGHAAPARHHARSREPAPVPARRLERVRLVRHVPSDRAGRRRGSRHVHPGAGDVPAAARRHLHAARRRGLARGRRRGAAAGADQPGRPSARARDHELRGDRPLLAGRRRRPPRVRQALRRDRVRPGVRRAALPAPPALPGRPGDLGRPRPLAGGPDAGPHRVGDGSRALPRTGARPGGSPGARRTPAQRDDGRTARPHHEPASARAAPAGSGREAGVRHRRGLEPRDGARARAALPRSELDLADLRHGVRARPERPAAPRRLERGGDAVRAPRLARAVPRSPRSGPDRRSSRATPSGRKASGGTPSPAISPSCWCASPGTTGSGSCVRSCRRRSTGGSRGSAPTS